MSLTPSWLFELDNSIPAVFLGLARSILDEEPMLPGLFCRNIHLATGIWK